MNRLHKDLNILVNRVEAWELSRVSAGPWRQKFHLMPPCGWMNDPNGLCWRRGNYHVYYQYSPFNAGGGLSFWGHWSSPDLLRWTQQPVLLCPDQPWDLHGVYSGSALVEDDTMYLFYTGNVRHLGDYDYINEGRGSNTALGVSRDGIHLDTKAVLLESKDYPPDISNHVRDPKVWKQDGKYYMALGARTRKGHGEALVYRSEDLRHWEHINVITTPEPFGYMWECPDLFQVDGQWILAVSPQGIKPYGHIGQNVYSCGYFPFYGDFRGEYTLGEYRELDSGFDYYAQQSFAAPDGRRIALGWMGMPDADYTNPTADFGWQHCLSVPRELHWADGGLTAWPVRELEQLRRNARTIEFSGTVQRDACPTLDLELENHGSRLTVVLAGAAEICWEDGLLTLTLDEACGSGRTVRTADVHKLRSLRLLVDSSSLELFLNDGEQVVTSRFYPGEPCYLRLEGEGTAKLYDMCAMEMKTIQ